MTTKLEKPTKSIVTPRQLRYAQNVIIAGKPRGEAARLAGYGKNTQENPSTIERSRGFLKLMEVLGIDDESILLELREGLMAMPKSDPTWGDKTKMMKIALQLRGHLGSDNGGDRQSRTLAFIQNFYGDKRK